MHPSQWKCLNTILSWSGMFYLFLPVFCFAINKPRILCPAVHLYTFCRSLIPRELLVPRCIALATGEAGTQMGLCPLSTGMHLRGHINSQKCPHGMPDYPALTASFLFGDWSWDKSGLEVFVCCEPRTQPWSSFAAHIPIQQCLYKKCISFTDFTGALFPLLGFVIQFSPPTPSSM